MRGELVPAGPPPALLEAAVRAGQLSGCQKSKRGAALLDYDKLPALGWNYPAIGTCDGSEACRRDCAKICVHAEQRPCPFSSPPPSKKVQLPAAGTGADQKMAARIGHAGSA